jgi:hypothetical protein
MRSVVRTGLFLAVIGLLAGGGTVSAQWSFGDHLNVSRSAPGGAVAKNGTIFIVGGTIIGEPNITPILEVRDPLTNFWAIKAPMPTRRTALATAVSGGRLYTFGGCPESHGYTGLDTVEIYDPSTNSWSSGTPMPWPRTGHEAVTARDGRIYVLGGYNVPPGHLDRVDIYDPQTDSWAVGAPMPTARQEFGSTLGPDGRIYTIGGSDQWRSGIMNVVEIYDPATDTWTTGAPMPTRRDGVGISFGPDGFIYAVGGWTGNYPYYGDITDIVEIYDPVKNKWGPGPRMLIPEYSPVVLLGADCRINVISGGGYGTSAIVQQYRINNRSKAGFQCGRVVAES